MPLTDPQKPIQERLALVQDRGWMLGEQGYILGIDLGGYGLRAALVDLQKLTYTSTFADIEEQDYTPEAILNQTLELAQGLLEANQVPSRQLIRVGVGFGGAVDPHQGVVLLSPRRPGWQDHSLKNYFEQAFDAVTLVDNDANLIALGEATFGIGHGCQHLCYMHLSSGVGCGLVLNGRLYYGATTRAGEIGHVASEPDTPGNNQSATLEELVSVNGLLQRARSSGLNTDDLSILFGKHDAAQQIVEETVQLLSHRIAHIVALLDPEIVVLGGVLVRKGGDSFVQAIASNVNRSLTPAFARPVQVVSSVLGSDSIAIGGLALALESLQA